MHTAADLPERPSCAQGLFSPSPDLHSNPAYNDPTALFSPSTGGSCCPQPCAVPSPVLPAVLITGIP